MTQIMQTKMITELDTLIAMADGLKDKATRLRKKLEPVQAPAPKGVRGLSDKKKAMILTKRRKHLNKIL